MVSTVGVGVVLFCPILPKGLNGLSASQVYLLGITGTVSEDFRKGEGPGQIIFAFSMLAHGKNLPQN